MPHETVPPQPSGIVPQLSPAGQVVSGVHAVTATCAVAECTADADVPIAMNGVAATTGAGGVAVSGSVDVPPGAMLGGLNAPVTPAGRSCTFTTTRSVVAVGVDTVYETALPWLTL